MTSSATGIATSTGAALVNRSTLPGGGSPCWRRTTRPPTAAQTSAMSNTHRRAAAIRRRVPAAVAPVAESRRARWSHAAISGGPASAATTIKPASHQASDEAGPGVASTAAMIPTAAAGRAAAAPPARATRATWRSDAPRARIMVNSVRRCSVTSRAPSSTTTAAMMARLTNSSDSVRCTASSVATNGERMMSRPQLSPNVTVADWPASALRLVPAEATAGR